MKVNIEVISMETIKPSSSTPHHLKNYQLSFLDQISPPVYMPLILFYEATNDAKLSKDNISSKLKASLSETLTHFYPLAGRLVDNISIDCNDEGVRYLESRANCQLSEVIKDSMIGEFNKFIPRKLDDLDDILLAVQVNFFKCGGMAIGACFSHKAADALSLAMLITSWAATARGDSRCISSPQFDSAKLFPPRNISGFKPSVGITKENIVIKKFVFSNSAVAALRDKYTDHTSKECPIRPTRVQALSTFIWDRYAAATQIESGPRKDYVVFHAVNLRPRMEPPLPDCSFGNLYRIAMATPSLDVKDRCIDLVRQMNESIKNIDSKYVRSHLQESNEHLDFIIGEAERFTKGEIVTFNFTSLCRFPLYEVDFGWGKPAMVGSTRFTFKNLVSFMDTKDGDGIEAWMNMEEGDMAIFEVDKELLAYASTSAQPFETS